MAKRASQSRQPGSGGGKNYAAAIGLDIQNMRTIPGQAGSQSNTYAFSANGGTGQPLKAGGLDPVTVGHVLSAAGYAAADLLHEPETDRSKREKAVKPEPGTQTTFAASVKATAKTRNAQEAEKKREAAAQAKAQQAASTRPVVAATPASVDRSTYKTGKQHTAAEVAAYQSRAKSV